MEINDGERERERNRNLSQPLAAFYAFLPVFYKAMIFLRIIIKIITNSN